MIPVPLLPWLKFPKLEYILLLFAKHGITVMVQRGMVDGSSVGRFSRSFYLSPIQWDQSEGRDWSEGKSVSSHEGHELNILSSWAPLNLVCHR